MVRSSPRNTPNPKLPAETRLYLEYPELCSAVTEYTSDGYILLNKYLRGESSVLEATEAAMHEALQDAFAEVDPFNPPIKVLGVTRLMAICTEDGRGKLERHRG
jgi:hypothetical protein